MPSIYDIYACYVSQVVVLLCGTNNHGDTVEQVTAGILEIFIFTFYSPPPIGSQF